MAFLLVIILMVSLTITLVGFLLSAKPQMPYQRAVYREASYVARSGRRVNEPLRTQRYVEYTEQHFWLDVWQAIDVGRMGRIFGRREGEPVSWIGIVLVLVSVCLLGMYLLRTLLPNATLIGAMAWPYNLSTTSTQTASQGQYHVSQKLVRIGQLELDQYNSTQEYNTWAYSACSAAAMTEVINAYGHHYRVIDILNVESQIGEITPQLGLVEGSGIARTVARFGFATTYMQKESLDDVINVANSGTPVIVSFPPDRFDGGHLLVVTGGNSDRVYLADSSSYNYHSLTRTQFMQWWEGFAAIVTPK